MTILFVENHSRFASVAIKTFLSAHTVMVVPSLAAARQVLTASRFDVVLIDYDLDDGKGAEIVQEVQNQVNRPIVIAISSHSAGNQALLQAGADAVCGKMDFKNIETVIVEARSKSLLKAVIVAND